MIKHGILILFSLLLIVSACKDKNEEPMNNVDAEFNNLKTSVKDNYANLVYTNYEAAHSDAVKLKEALYSFTSSPTDISLQAAKDAWFLARESYGITEAFRFADGPIDIIGSEEGPEGLLNSWPLDENFIDYVDGSSNAGIINNAALYPTITKAALVDSNGSGGESNVTVGYHAIEFLLWGQDLTDPSMKQAGKRLFTDFVDGGTAANQDRRRKYLEVCGDLLLDHLQLLLDQWKSGGPYRSTFSSMENNKALTGMMTSIASLSKSELAGERVFTAYDNRDQEDEHSCFSDNTHRDLRLNFEGIRNVYFSILNGIESTSIDDLIENKNATLAAEIRTAMETARIKVYGTAVPFDFAISDDSERPKVIEAVTALRVLGDKISEGGSAIGLTVTNEL